ncbi:MAG TPA: hypothetical protein VFU02_23610, partial [Polyangiaceae bacterium]|nr:hypothetical protein [Polyangiaceae bacterium]
QSALEFWHALESAAGPALALPPRATPTQQPSVLPDSALADTEQLAIGARSADRAPNMGSKEPVAARPSEVAPTPRATARARWQAFGALGLLVGGLVAAAAVGQRAGAPASASSIQSARPLASAPLVPGVAPPPASSARVPTAASSHAQPALAQSAARLRPPPKPGASARLPKSTPAPTITSTPAVPTPRASGVAGQLELKTQGP